MKKRRSAARNLTAFKINVDVDQNYLSQVYTGIKGSFTFNDSLYAVVTKKVYAQVANGRFQIDMEFIGKAPQGIRRGQTLQITLALSDPTKALLIPKGGFYQQTGGNWIFKVSADGKTAYRTALQLGRVSIDTYEVLSGLKPGDRVITSSYDNYGNIEELVLK